jgi:predicted Zn-dependent protease
VVVVVSIVAVLAVGLVLRWQWNRMVARADRERALELAGQGRFADALPLLLNALENNRDDREVVRALALAHLAGGGVSLEAETYLNRWCALDPNSLAAHKLRMELSARLFHRDQALADGLRVLELSPDNDEVRRAVVWMLMAVGRLDDARRECTRGLQSHPGDPEYRLIQARLAYLRGDIPEAVALLDGLLAQVPNNPGAALFRATLHLEANQPEQAIPLLRVAVSSEPDPNERQSARYQLSQALNRLGRTEEADAMLGEFQRIKNAERLATDAEQQPNDLEIQTKAAEGLLAVGEDRRGVQLLQGVVRRAPQHPAANRALADYYERHGQTEAAARHRRWAPPGKDSSP